MAAIRTVAITAAERGWEELERLVDVLADVETTAAPWSSPWLPDGYGQDFRPAT